MRTWRFIEQGPDGVTPVVREYTDAEVLAEFFDHWAHRLRQIGKAHLITTEACIEDWALINCAEACAPCPECERSHGPHYRGPCPH